LDYWINKLAKLWRLPDRQGNKRQLRWKISGIVVHAFKRHDKTKSIIWNESAANTGTTHVEWRTILTAIITLFTTFVFSLLCDFTRICIWPFLRTTRDDGKRNYNYGQKQCDISHAIKVCIFCSFSLKTPIAMEILLSFLYLSSQDFVKYQGILSGHY